VVRIVVGFNDFADYLENMGEYEAGDVIDPEAEDLDPETLRALRHAIRGFSETSPAKPTTELSEYRAGRHSAFSAVMALLSVWLEETEGDTKHDSR
jgi:hypothetical protein